MVLEVANPEIIDVCLRTIEESLGKRGYSDIVYKLRKKHSYIKSLAEEINVGKLEEEIIKALKFEVLQHVEYVRALLALNKVFNDKYAETGETFWKILSDEAHRFIKKNAWLAGKKYAEYRALEKFGLEKHRISWLPILGAFFLAGVLLVGRVRTMPTGRLEILSFEY